MLSNQVMGPASAVVIQMFHMRQHVSGRAGRRLEGCKFANNEVVRWAPYPLAVAESALALETIGTARLRLNNEKNVIEMLCRHSGTGWQEL